MANEMQGMFGQDPALVEQALRQQQDQQIAQQAQMDPWSVVAYGAGTGASRLSGGIGGMLGYEAPEMKQANTIKQVQEESLAEAKAMGIDPSKDMDKFGEIVAGKYTQYGMPDKAFGVQQLIQGMKAQQAKIYEDTATAQLKQAQAKKALKDEDPVLNLVKTGKISPEQYAKYMRGELSMDQLALIDNASKATPFYQFIPGQGGEIYAGNARTGGVEKVSSGGSPVIKAEYSIPLQTELARGKKAGTVLGEAETSAKIDLPQKLAASEQALQQVDELLSHPGFSTTVGATLMPGLRFVPGSSASDFMSRLDQVKGGSFLEAYKTLKGGGQITEVEGKKATDAINAMSISQSEEEFRAAANRYKGIIKAGMERAKRGIIVGKPDSGQTAIEPKTTASTAISLDSYLKSKGY